MCRVLIFNKLNEEIKEEDVKEINELAFKIESWIKEGNKKKIMQLKKI